MSHITSFAALLGLLILCAAPPASGAEQWTEGVNYFLVPRARPAVTLPHDKVEVTEVFSYGCPACNAFLPVMHKLAKSLPANAVLDYVPASFNASEDWPMFQRAYYAAQALGIAEKTHDAMFDAVWKNRTLATFDPTMQHLVDHMPTIEDAAKFYNKVAGVPVQSFLDKANKDFGVDTNMRNAEAFIEACRVASTPTIVVNGKYRLDAGSAGGPDQLIELVNWLVAKESH
ncbi:MAG: thiol:disulfide interchange protein DsbA/DsbL [Steroidobacteraceae bacterium]